MIADAKREALLAIPQLVRLGRGDLVEAMRRRARRAQIALNGHCRDLDYDREAADRLEGPDEVTADGYVRGGGHYARVQKARAGSVVAIDGRLLSERDAHDEQDRVMSQSDLFSRGGVKRRFASSADDQSLHASGKGQKGSRTPSVELSSEGARRQDYLRSGGWLPFEPDTSGMPVGRPANEPVDDDAAHALIDERITSVASRAGFAIDVDVFAATLTKRGRPTAAHEAGRMVFAWVVAKADVTGPALVGYLGRFGVSERTAYRLHERGVGLIGSELPVRVRALSSHVPGVRARTPGPCPPFLIQLEEPSN